MQRYTGRELTALRADMPEVRCSADGCWDKAAVTGMCLLHYQRQRNGVPLASPLQTHRLSPEGAPKKGEPCSIEGCQMKVIAMGLCWGHYRRERRGVALHVPLYKPDGAKHARAVKFGPRNAPFRVRRRALFEWYLREGLVTPEPNTGCLLWLGSYNEQTGRPHLGNDRDPWGGYAHRAAVYFDGTALERRNRKRHARHLCDNPGCVAAAFNAPVSAHVVYGTATENAADRERRYARGEIKRKLRGAWKLTPQLVAYIVEAHAAGLNRTELARDLGLNWQTVDRAVRGGASPLNQNSSQAA
jgi:hypothetical protein